jgi:hypothetical protein
LTIVPKHIKIIEIQRERGTRIIPNQALDDVRNPSKDLRRLWFLALDDLISNDLMPWGAGGCLYILGVQHESLDQTDLKDIIDAILGGGGGSF